MNCHFLKIIYYIVVDGHKYTYIYCLKQEKYIFFRYFVFSWYFYYICSITSGAIKLRSHLY